MIYTFASLRKLASVKELKRESLILASKSVIDTKFDRDDAFRGKMKGRLTVMDVHGFIEENSKLLEEEDLLSDLTVKSIMGLEGLKSAFLADFDDEFNETSLVYGIAVNP
jgi:hypothetical protein